VSQTGDDSIFASGRYSVCITRWMVHVEDWCGLVDCISHEGRIIIMDGNTGWISDNSYHVHRQTGTRPTVSISLPSGGSLRT